MSQDTVDISVKKYKIDRGTLLFCQLLYINF
jgi:hypothetical protein